MKFYNFLIIFFLVFGLGMGRVQAQGTGLSGVNLYNNQMAIDSFGFLNVNSPELGEQGEWFLKVGEDFRMNHLLNLSINGAPQDVVESAMTTDFLISKSFTDFFTAALDVPLHFWLQERNVNTGQEFTTSSAGDIRLATKFRLLNEGKVRPGLAALATVTLPSGDEGKFMGDNWAVPSIELIVGKNLDYINILLNIGAAFPSETTIAGIDFDDRVTAALGVNIPLYFINETWAVVAEARGSFQPKDIQTVTSPLSVLGGVTKSFNNGLQIEAAAGGSLTNAVGNARLHAFISLGYAPN